MNETEILAFHKRESAWGILEKYRREEWIIDQHEAGRTFASIGRDIGLGRERVRAIYRQGKRRLAFQEVLGNNNA